MKHTKVGNLNGSVEIVAYTGDFESKVVMFKPNVKELFSGELTHTDAISLAERLCRAFCGSSVTERTQVTGQGAH